MEIEQFLDKINLSQYEKQAYLALLKLGNSKSRKISKESNVSYGRIYEILDKLKERGLISVFPTEPKTFEAIDPKISFNQILKKQEEELQSLQREIKNILIPKPKIPIFEEDKTIVLEGKQKQLSMIGDMHERTKKEFLTIPGVYEPNISRNIVTLRALNRGIKIKRLIRKINPKNKEILEKSKKLGEEIRQNKLSGLRLMVSDRREAMISIVNPKTKSRISIYTTNKEFSSSMAHFFESLWDKSKKIQI